MYSVEALAILAVMTRPKKWFLVQDTDQSPVIKNTNGLIKKPNAVRPLGKIIEVRCGLDVLRSTVATLRSFNLYSITSSVH